MPPNTIKVDRSTKWGNPYKIIFVDNVHLVIWRDDETQVYLATNDKLLAVERAVELYESYIRERIKSRSLKIKDICGKNLGCWCRLETEDRKPYPCHANVLIEIAKEHCKDV